MELTKIHTLFSQDWLGNIVQVKGWVRTFRANRFVSINDGSTIENLQCVVDFEKVHKDTLKAITTGASISVEGEIVKSLGSGQTIELIVHNIEIIGVADSESYPIQPKKHSLEFLRENTHLRIRTNTIAAIMRVRSQLAQSIHGFFNDKQFCYIHTPIITSNDAEGAGDMFRVTTLDPTNPPIQENGNPDFKKDFFGKKTHLTVSGQLEAEIYALGLGNVYTFGPTFRAENSNTARHLAEFWMIEPEMAFYDLKANIDLAEEFICKIIKDTTSKCIKDMDFLNQRFIKEQESKPKLQRSPWNLIERIDFITTGNFERVTYDTAIEILKNSKPNKKNKFRYPVTDWGIDLQSEHERFLVEKYFRKPVVIYNYPAKIKAFYMRLNEDQRTVAAMDILFPGIGEIVGGSQREERLGELEKRIKDFSIDPSELKWYLDLRRFGSAPHSGFGLGFERLVQFVTGMSNIRDVIPFPRTPQNTYL